MYSANTSKHSPNTPPNTPPTLPNTANTGGPAPELTTQLNPTQVNSTKPHQHYGTPPYYYCIYQYTAPRERRQSPPRHRNPPTNTARAKPDRTQRAAEPLNPYPTHGMMGVGSVGRADLNTCAAVPTRMLGVWVGVWVRVADHSSADCFDEQSALICLPPALHRNSPIFVKREVTSGPPSYLRTDREKKTRAPIVSCTWIADWLM